MSFAAQTSIASSLTRGFAGMLANCVNHTIANGLPTSRKYVSVAVTAANSTHYIVTIVQNGVSAAYDYTSDGSATTAEIVLGLVALINAGTQSVLAAGTDTPLLIESTADGADYEPVITYNSNMVETVLVAQSQSLGFGLGVCKDERSTRDDAVRAPRQSTDVTGGRFLGVTVADFAQVPPAGATVASFAANHMIPVLRKGQVYVSVEQSVVPGDPVYCRYAAGGTLGAFGNTAGTSERALVPGAVYRSTAAISGVAVMELNAP